jgi:hypothetical protein
MSFQRAIIYEGGFDRLARAYTSVQSEVLACLVWLRLHHHRLWIPT